MRKGFTILPGLRGWTFAIALALLPPAHAQFSPAPKPKPLLSLRNSDRAQFGYLTVPENRASGSPRTIQLAIVIVPARNAAPKPDPVFYFVGGPGGSATLSSSSFPVFEVLNEDRDIVFVDPRGAGLSIPHLDPRKNGLTISQFARANREHFRSRGIDLTGYNTTEMAADYEAARVALGYGPINIFANSFGTFVAQEFVRRYPSSIRCMVMSGNSPATDPFLPTVLEIEEQGINALLNDVQRNPAARRAYPFFRLRFYNLVNRLGKRPVRLRLENRDTGREENVTISDTEFLEKITALLQRTQTLRLIPLLVAQMERRQYHGLTRRFFRPRETLNRDSSFGLYLSVLATDFAAPGYVQATRRGILRPDNAVLINAEGLDILQLALIVEAWKLPYNPGTTRQLPTSSVPTLFVNGRMDAQTPVSGGATIAAGFSAATNFIYPRIGHAVGFLYGPDLDAAVAFIGNPAAPPAFSTGTLTRSRFYEIREPKPMTRGIDDWEDYVVGK